jgi:hypothetical protein
MLTRLGVHKENNKPKQTKSKYIKPRNQNNVRSLPRSSNRSQSRKANNYSKLHVKSINMQNEFLRQSNVPSLQPNSFQSSIMDDKVSLHSLSMPELMNQYISA